MSAVDHPEHYGGDTTYEAIKVIEAWGLGFCLGNAVKYIARCGRKPGADPIDDLEKTLWYVSRELSARKAERAQIDAADAGIRTCRDCGEPLAEGHVDCGVPLR